jgi:glucose-6-phosphate 1-dehydrogenase
MINRLVIIGDLNARHLLPAPAALCVAPDLPAYGRLLLDVPHGNAALAIRGDELWRVLAPVMPAWSRNLAPLGEYPAGSDGPASVTGPRPRAWPRRR